ncbi:hypothetical protein B0T26DRAFT_795155 [Lasiosphaeria miniovina]|uniref:Potassium channel domain-containing protein n=1 Tax=Lasiosphaeria miniovina TaxID=1954250 RepID=A0AA40DFN1_9PEZI|nr:uncharacterized protein B0T26DRAFT_795155 [Lasiosphaeria miniovina]KAK0701674.1 hypothetical protein B0T26DRAFT_795155 [Lasiosphaeria miniovina]
MRTIAGGLIKLRGRNDRLPQQWWFASTAIPLIAATIGPLSNVLSIAALVTPWRVMLPDDGLPSKNGRGSDDAAVGIADPHWQVPGSFQVCTFTAIAETVSTREIIWNAISLVCGFTGNIFLLLNFTGRVRYIIALPLSILLWVLSAVILIAIEIAMNAYVPPVPPGSAYSQGFWHSVLASALYLVGSGILTINIVGYFRGHYPQQFHLDDDQRTLILQTMMFFFWLAGGSGVFCALEGFTYTDALYYADVSVLTIGFGDFAPATDPGRGFLFVFQLTGIIFLGLVIASISRFVTNISADKIIKQHQRHARESTVGRAVTSEKELRERLGLPPRSTPAPPADDAATTTTRISESGRRRSSFAQYGRLEIVGHTVTFYERKKKEEMEMGSGGGGGLENDAAAAAKIGPPKKRLSLDSRTRAREAAKEKRKRRRQKLLLLQKEKDRFDAMRQIQDETRRWKQYWALGMAFLAFGILWCLGALVFMLTEARISQLRYFDCLYLCFVALLTIGYGDYAPKSNIGKPFFIVWSLVAVPIVTVLIQEMSRTVVSAVNRGTFTVADWTVLPKQGVLKHFLDRHPKLYGLLARLSERRQQRKRIARGFQVQDPDEEVLGSHRRRPSHSNRWCAASPQEFDQVVAVAAAPTAALTAPPFRTVMFKLDGDGDDKGPRKTASAEEPGIGSAGRQQQENSQEDGGDGAPYPAMSLEGIADELIAEPEDPSHDLARQLAMAIKSVAHDLRLVPPKRYSYEDWVHFTHLVRFSSSRINKNNRHGESAGAEGANENNNNKNDDEDDEGLVEWDWIGEDSPMLADITEAEWVLDRLCESLNRYTRRQARKLPQPPHHKGVDNPAATTGLGTVEGETEKVGGEAEEADSGSGSSSSSSTEPSEDEARERDANERSRVLEQHLKN